MTERIFKRSKRPSLASNYRRCPVCHRYVVHMNEHLAKHRSGVLNRKGKRTNRSPAEARRWAQRNNKPR